MFPWNTPPGPRLEQFDEERRQRLREQRKAADTEAGRLRTRSRLGLVALIVVVLVIAVWVVYLVHSGAFGPPPPPPVPTLPPAPTSAP